MNSEKEKLLIETIRHNSCTLCKSENILELHRCHDHFVSGEIFPVMKCGNCGFIFTNDYPTEELIGTYYKSENYISHSNTNKGLVNRLYHIARSFMLKRKYRIIRTQTGLPSGRLMDIGCGTGYFPDFMSKKGWVASGIEKDRGARQYASIALNVDVYDSEKIYHLEPSGYDCITLWHVLEHFHDPDSVIRAIGPALNDSGIGIIALPNNRSYDSSHYGAHWAAWDVPRHLWHFTPDTFSLYLRKHGMEIISIKRLPLDAFYVSLLSEKYKGSKLALFSGFIIGIASLLKSLVNKSMTSSLVYIIRKAES